MIQRQPIAKQTIIHLTLLQFFLLSCAIFTFGCGAREKPPFFQARVLDLWNQTTVVEHFKIYYWWEERGETPFLKPYAYHAKEFVLELMVPVPGNAHQVSVVTQRIPFQDIERFFFIRGEIGNTIKVKLKSGTEVIATDRFPATLKKEGTAGFADSKIFVEGVTVRRGKREEFRAELYNIKQVELLKTSDQ